MYFLRFVFYTVVLGVLFTKLFSTSILDIVFS
jgi:hypothetical protein